MRRSIICFVALAGLFALGVAQADQAEFPPAQIGPAYAPSKLDKAVPIADGAAPVPLPVPVIPEPSSLSRSAKDGPTGSVIGAGALVGPRGGAMSTPKQQADREVRKLIRRLG